MFIYCRVSFLPSYITNHVDLYMRVLWAIPWSRVINNIYQQQIAFVSVRRRRPSAREATPSDGNSLNPATLLRSLAEISTLLHKLDKNLNITLKQSKYCPVDLWTPPSYHICVLRKSGAHPPRWHLRVPPFCIAMRSRRSHHEKQKDSDWLLQKTVLGGEKLRYKCLVCSQMLDDCN